MKDDSVYIQHIVDAIGTIEQYVQGIEFESFVENKLVQDGVVRQIEIIGEASKWLSDTFKRKHRDIPWKDVAGMRDKLIHDYMAVDLIVVWETVKRDITFLKEKLRDSDA